MERSLPRRIVITVILGIAAAASGIAAYTAYNDKLELDRIYEMIKYTELGADPHGLYSGYSVEELCEGYEKPPHFFDKVLIEDFPVISQYPELPTGCEITCGAALLQYLGFDADKVALCDMFMRQNDNFYMDDRNILHGPDPEYSFAGDPRGHGYGCYEKVIADALNSYFMSEGESEKYEAVTLPGLNTADMEKLLDKGVPVIVWASGEMEVYRYSDQSKWVITGTTREVEWLGNSHTLVLVGYDQNAYYFMDCGETSAIVPYSKEAFSLRFAEHGRRACAVKIKGKDIEK